MVMWAAPAFLYLVFLRPRRASVKAERGFDRTGMIPGANVFCCVLQECRISLSGFAATPAEPTKADDLLEDLP
jgi:hypothetical protein